MSPRNLVLADPALIATADDRSVVAIPGAPAFWWDADQETVYVHNDPVGTLTDYGTRGVELFTYGTTAGHAVFPGASAFQQLRDERFRLCVPNL